MALTEQQKESVLAMVRPSGSGLHQAVASLGLTVEQQDVVDLVSALKIPDIPLDEWSQAQLQEEVHRMNALKEAHPEKTTRVDARLAAVQELLE